ncbi:hypothetical protein [Sphingomonas sp. Leaf33]|uniref:hypothetical protein n=1 Tax=Sphingomonas sp. Leaf33 TaxID=1736215 RepID=UPI000A7E6BFE|nr:hypothetical protein [Sphingomonas sp. Leaf33]
MRGRRLIGSCAVLLAVGACSNDARPQFISDTGITREVDAADGTSPYSDGLLYQFKLAALEARPFTTGTPPTLK